jgi:hypothetical protein
MTPANLAQKPGTGVTYQDLTFLLLSVLCLLMCRVSDFFQRVYGWNEKNQERRLKCLKKRMVIRKELVKWIFKALLVLEA